MHQHTARMKLLTRRQREVLVLVANGNTNAEIAVFLGITATTVNETLGRAYRTLGARDRAHAVSIAQAVGEIGVHEIFIPDEQREEAA